MWLYLCLLLSVSQTLVWMYLHYRKRSESQYWKLQYQQARQDLEQLRSEYLQSLELQSQLDLAKAKALEWDLQ